MNANAVHAEGEVGEQSGEKESPRVKILRVRQEVEDDEGEGDVEEEGEDAVEEEREDSVDEVEVQ